MPLVPPNLDTRTFEDILTEVRRRVPTLAPEWTDLNDGDPGITLAQLFAFMSEQLLFQVNQVPNKGLVTFLKMVGAELHPATPAVADVTFTFASTSSDLTFDLDAGTQVQTSGPPPGEKTAITFETEDALTVLNGSLADLVSSDCNLNFVSHKTANESLTETFAPLGGASTTLDAFYLVFSLNTTVPSPEWPDGTVRVRVNVAGSKDVGKPPAELFESGAPQRLEWSFASDANTNPDGSKTLVFTSFSGGHPSLDSTNELTQSGYLEFTFDPVTAPTFLQAPPEVEPAFFAGFFVIRAILKSQDAYADVGVPSLNTVRLNTTSASAVQTVVDEFLGGSSGLPFQRLRLSHAPVVVGSTEIRVDESAQGGGETVWNEIGDLFDAGPGDRVYELLPATGEILFGDGVTGRIPPPDDGSVPGGNIRASTYRFGGGLRGNVGTGTLTNVVLTGSGPSFDATNVLSAAGGADEEPVSQGVARAPAVVRSRFRAVSAADFEALARETPNVRVDRALAIPNTRPGLPPGSSPGSVTVALVPFAIFEESIQAPILVQPSVAAAVLRFPHQRRLVTTEVFTRSADFRKVTAEVTVQLEPRASLTGTRTAVLDALNRFFHALVGGVDGTGWPFGGTIFFSSVFERILGVPGVLRVEQLLLGLDEAPRVDCTDLPLRAGELLFSGPHIVRVRTGA